MVIHHTKGIVLRTVKYGETSVVATLYTELFGLQSYMVKGVRASNKKNSTAANYFQPGAILEMQVYHQEQKNLQFIKSYNWAYIYKNLLFEVVRNSVAVYMIDLLQHCLREPEANPELFYLMEDSLKQADTGTLRLVSNLPVYFTLHLAAELGFQLQGNYSIYTPVIDLQEGKFTTETPLHEMYVVDACAEAIGAINNITFYNDLENIQLHRAVRQNALQHLIQYMQLHVPGFGNLKTVEILQQILQ